MSFRRRMPGADSTPPPRSPEGLPLCRWCKHLVAPPRETFCSDACVHEWKLRTDSGYVRGLLFERDHGICSLCGLDTVALRETFVRACFELLGRPRVYTIDYRRPQAVLVPAFERLKALDLDPHRHTYWDADHVVPVAEGGGECGLDGYRTICIPCHKRVSREQKQARRQAA